jgi:hypothetical protein
MESVNADTVHEELPVTPEETTPHQQEALHGFTIPITLPAEVQVFMHIANSFAQIVIHTAKPLLCISVISRYFLFFCRLHFEKNNKVNPKTQH